MIMTVASAIAQAVSGKVVDENNTPLDFVNVVLVNKADSTYISGTVSGEDGSFIIEKNTIPALIRFSSIGYKTITKDIPPTGNLGTIAMAPENVILGEVVVKSNRPVTAIKGNALVTTVDGSQLAHAGTANDVLKQVPMVLGSDGNFEVFGKGSPAIYINGRLVQDMTELSQLNSADIKNVEVITNPGAKYDASVKSVIRIRTKRPRGDGFSGNIRVQGVWQKYFRNLDWANFKYRTGGLELFCNFGYIGGKFQSATSSEMLTRSTTLWNQLIDLNGHMRKNEFFGKAGFTYMFNDRHSIGAYYSNGFTKSRSQYTGTSRIFTDNIPYDELSMRSDKKNDDLPKHHANFYYNGSAGQLGIDFNMDYLWRKSRDETWNDESSDNFDNLLVNSLGINRSRMFAEKLVLSYPLWKGGIELGEEYTTSRFSSSYNTDASRLNDSDSRVEENNIAGFVEIGQQLGHFNVAAGLRYEHVTFDYMENGQKRDSQSKSYNNLFPSLSLSTMLKNVQMSLSYTHKTQRPNYKSLDGNVDFINRFTFEGGNPYLKPTKIHSLGFMGAWRQLFVQISYLYLKDPILNTTVPYGEDGEIKLITKDNFPKIQNLQVFAGGQFKVGIWQPKVNVGIIKQWLTIDYGDGRRSLDNPLGLVQFQNAIHLPGDIWLNADLQWMSAGNVENAKRESSSYTNVKLYKAFFNNQFCVTLEANDIFNKSASNFTLYNRDVTIFKTDNNYNRNFIVTLQYTFNATRDRYKGRGAGTDEMSRF